MIYDISGTPLTAEGLTAEDWKINGVLNADCVTKQLCKMPWRTTNSGMPNAKTGTISSGTTTVGMPYSSASVEDGYIGISISLYTFMSAVNNPRSVLYTERSKGYTGYAYYGTVCTSLVCAAWGLPCLVTTVAFPKCDFIKEVQFSEMELGDMILSLGAAHAMMISGITRNSDGTIATVQTSESKYTHCVANSYQTYSDFVSSHGGYKAYRYDKIDFAKSYTPFPTFPLNDEVATEIVYPDIMTKFGDKVTRKKGTDIVINVLDSTGYDSIKVYKDGALIDTKTTIADFTISAPDVGSYEVRMTGTGKSSSTFFDIVDCTISVTGNTLTFTTTYNALAVGGFPTYTVDANGNATSWNNPKRVHLVTNEENVNRTVDITEMRNDSDCNGGVRVYVKGIYGSVSFEHKYS